MECVNTSIIAAVSGGRDSMTMMFALDAIREELGLTIHVLTVDHGVREDSAADLDFVRQYAEELDLPWHGVSVAQEFQAEKKVVIGTRTVGPPYWHGRLREDVFKTDEQALRDVRYAAFERVAHELGVNIVATAHTWDDNAETVLMNIVRGTGLSGLSGIPPVRLHGDSGLKIVRPMLRVDPFVVRYWSNRNRIKWRDDPTNTNTRYLRNRIRHLVMPHLKQHLGDSIVDKLNGVAGLAREASSSHGLWSAINVRSYVLELTDMNIGRAATSRIQSLEHSDPGTKVDIARGYFAVRNEEFIEIQEPIQRESPLIDISAPGVYHVDGFALIHTVVPRTGLTIVPSPWIGYFDASRRSNVLYWRQWEPDDTIVPFGMVRDVHVSSLLSNTKVPYRERPGVRVVEDDQELLWVCGVRASESYRVTESTSVVRVLAVVPTRDQLIDL
jgi:tRNA(Ile)-lysidine synthase